jgi:hypothetical protein
MNANIILVVISIIGFLFLGATSILSDLTWDNRHTLLQNQLIERGYAEFRTDGKNIEFIVLDKPKIIVENKQ